jgi:hypothetical protein
MSPRNSSTLYLHVLEISEDYLGPAAPRFLERLVLNHLGKPAAKISESDLPQLVVWIKLATTMITNDENSVNEYMHRLETLADQNNPHRAAQKLKQVA